MIDPEAAQLLVQPHPPVVDGYAIECSSRDDASGLQGPIPSFSIPQSDLELFAQLPDSCCTEIRELLLAFKSVASARNKTAELRRLSALLNTPFATLRRKWFVYLRSGGDWQSLVNRAKAGPAWWNSRDRIGLPPAFLEFWRTLVERNQRSDKSAHAELKQIYRTGIDSLGAKHSEIPGYGPIRQIPPDPYTGLPRGWSYENLARHTSTAFAKSAMRQGRFAASNHRRKVFTSRYGLAVGQVVFFDDQEYDLKVNFIGNAQRRATRPLGFNALDLLSACSFAQLFKPTLIDDESQRKQKLRETEMREFLVSVLTCHGFNPHTGTVLVVEHGTAAISEDLESLLFDLSGGRIIVDRSGLFGAPSVSALFEGSSRGNPRFKAPLESFFNLVRNRFAALPGQTGLSRDRCPDELAGRDAYNTRLLRAAAVQPDLLARLQLPFLEWTEFVSIATELYRLINSRTDHELEGWAKCGHFTKEWRTSIASQHWLSMDEFLALAPEAQMTYAALFAKPEGAGLTRCRPLSPLEVFNAGAKGLQRLPLDLVPKLLGPSLATERRVVNGYITIEDQTVSSDPLRFPVASLLSERETYLCYLHAHAASGRPALVIADARNRFVCAVPAQETPCRLDTDAVTRQIAAARAEESALLAPLQQRHAAAARAKAAMHAHNAAVLAGRPATPEDRAAAAQRADLLRETTLSAEDRAAALDCNSSLPADDVSDDFAALFRDAVTPNPSTQNPDPSFD